jgi:hypothetical protein
MRGDGTRQVARNKSKKEKKRMRSAKVDFITIRLIKSVTINPLRRKKQTEETKSEKKRLALSPVTSKPLN